MLESFFLKANPSKVNNSWELKKVLALEIFKRPALRYMRPNLEESRTRLDVMLLGGKLGIRGPSLEQGDFEFYPFKNPDAADPKISEMMRQLEESSPSIDMAQIRFRCGPNDNKGIWIDCSKQSIEDSLAEGTWLKSLLSIHWQIEMGQKNLEVFCENDKLKLQPAVSKCWLPSFDRNNQEIPLKSSISAFSQPGPEANRALIACAYEICDSHSITPKSWAEWGAGYGNLSAAFSSFFKEAPAWASEADPHSALMLYENSQRFFPNVRTEKAWAQKWDRSEELLIMDPPRSGFPDLIDSLKDNAKAPRWILAIHCHHRGLLSDSQRLKAANYKLLDWSCVDTFPATPHMEHISLWQTNAL